MRREELEADMLRRNAAKAAAEELIKGGADDSYPFEDEFDAADPARAAAE